MIIITVFANSQVMMYVTKDYTNAKDFLGDLVMVRENRIKCVWFKDVNGILVSIPPESCLIEVEEIKENDDAS